MSSKRTVLITGCSDGSLGSCLALAFHKRGWRVFASARNTKKLQKCVEADIETLQLDVSSDESVAMAVSTIKELTGGSLDALVNNAGRGYCMPLLDVELDKVKEVFDQNVISVLRMTRAFFPLLVQSERGALVVNHTAGMALKNCAFPFHGSYAASKAAVSTLTEIMRLELRPFGIRAINMLTGGVKSTLFEKFDNKLPPTSLYNAAKERVESAMSSDIQEGGMDPVEWAEAVVRDLDKSNPQHWIFRGKNALLGHVVSYMPVGLLDSVMKQMTGLDVFEQKFKEQGGLAKLKLAQ